MTAHGTGAAPPLDGFRLIEDGLRLLLRRVSLVFAIGFPIGVAALILTWILAGPEAIVGAPPPAEDADIADIAAMAGFDPLGQAVALLIALVAYAVTTAALVLVTLDTKADGGRPAAVYLAGSVQFIGPVLIAAFAVGLAVSVGLLLFVVPGLWAAALLSVAMPVVVLEGKGLSALGRSAELTRDYRWPIVGLYLVIVAASILVAIVLGLLVGLPLALFAPSPGQDPNAVFVALTLLVDAAASALSNGFGAILVTLLYARLREIKEGVRLPHLRGR